MSYVGYQVKSGSKGKRFHVRFMVGGSAKAKYLSAMPGWTTKEAAEKDAQDFVEAIQSMKPDPKPVRYIPWWAYAAPAVFLLVAAFAIARSSAL